MPFIEKAYLCGTCAYSAAVMVLGDGMVAMMSAWSRMSLVRQFFFAGGIVMLLAMLGIVTWVSQRIEDVVVRTPQTPPRSTWKASSRP